MPDEGFLGAMARIASTFVGGAPDGHKNVWNAVAPWLNELARSASARWLPYLVLGIPCEIVFIDTRTKAVTPCTSAAVAACAICRKPCCPNHAFVSRAAEACCFSCIQKARGIPSDPAVPPHVPWPRGTAGNPGPRPAEPAPPPQPKPPAETPLDVQYRSARRVLGVKQSASWEEIHSAQKQLLKKFHPDRNPGDKRSAERYLQVRAAYDLLRQAYPEANR